MMNIDDFKQINDLFGHSVGDRVLVNTARLIREAAKENSGFAFRYGGEGFLIVCSDCTGQQACQTVKRIQDRLKEGLPEFERAVTLSFGVYSAVPADRDTMEMCCLAADNLLYTSKQNGKNTFTLWEKASDEPAHR